MAVAERISEILRQYVEPKRNIKFIAIVDDKGFVISSYPLREERFDLIETLSAVFSDILQNIIDTISEHAPNIAGKIISITLGFERIKIELYPVENYRVIIFEKIE